MSKVYALEFQPIMCLDAMLWDIIISHVLYHEPLGLRDQSGLHIEERKP